MENEFLMFIALCGGIGLLCYHSIRVAQAHRDTTGETVYIYTVHAIFAYGCAPFVYDAILFDAMIYGLSFKKFVVTLSLLGWTTLYAIGFEIILRKKPDLDGIWYAVWSIPIAIFDVWQLYEIVWVRQNFWVLLLPIIVAFWVVKGIFEDDNTQESLSPTPAPSQPTVIIDDDDHPIKADPASVFEKRRR